MLTKYYFEHRKFKKPIIVGYNEWGVLAFLDAEHLDEPQSVWFTQNIPVRESYIDQYKKDFPYIRINKAIIDTSFEAAYNAYNYKVGKKEKARKIWDGLPEVERQAFFKMLNDYNMYLAKSKTAKAYFETFLNNCYWKNDFKSQLL